MRIGFRSDGSKRMHQRVYCMKQLEKRGPKRRGTSGSLYRQRVEGMVDRMNASRRRREVEKEGWIKCTTRQEMIS